MATFRRRSVLKLGAGIATAVSCPAVLHGMELKLGGQDFHQIRTFHPRRSRPFLCTMCPYFDGGLTYLEADRIEKAEGDPDHIATRGKLCSKGLSSFFAAYDPDRILAPLKRVGPRGSGKWQEISWEQAVGEVADKVNAALESNPDLVVLNEGGFKDGGSIRFMDTIGSASVVRSRMPSIGCAAKQRVLRSAMGVDFALPDLEHAHYVLNFGANIMETAYPLAQRLTDGIVNSRLKLVTFDVRLSNTAGRSHEWIPLFPGTDGIVALAMAHVILKEKLEDRAFIEAWCNQTVEQIAEAVKSYTPEMAAKVSGVPASKIRAIAVEFAKHGPAAIFTANGTGWHHNGISNETACLLLAVITGNIEREGGYCLPRNYAIGVPQPAPTPRLGKDEPMRYNYTLPFEVKEGQRQVAVLINHMSNPAYSSPAASLWQEVMKDEKLLPFIVDFSPFMSESAELADLILPDVVAVERDDVASSPTALLPWASMNVPNIKPVGSAQDVRMTLKQIVEKLDPDGKRGMKQFWKFSNTVKYVQQELAATPGLEKQYKKLQKEGFWPNYGKIDSGTRQIMKGGKAVVGQYGMHQPGGFPTPSGKIELGPLTWEANPALAELKEGEMVLTTFKVAYHTNSMTSNHKYLSELWHSNPVWINTETAKKLGIKDGDLVRLTSPVGYVVTKAWVTQGIHPQVVGVSTSTGRTAYGRVAQADLDAKSPVSRPEQEDPDIQFGLWWRDTGVSVNSIIPVAVDAASGVQAWNDTVVTVGPAQPGDRYGQVEVDNAKHLAIYRTLPRQA